MQNEIVRYLSYDGALVSSTSALGKELMKWERKPDWTPEGNPFPRMLYRAMHRKDGRRSVGEVLDDVCGENPGAAEQWSRRCQLTVFDEHEQTRAFEQGWRKTPQEALDHLEALDNAASNITAERHRSDSLMSGPAQSEAAKIDGATLKQIPSIPEQPRVRRKYTRKVKVAEPSV